jgi:phenylacetate-coenzyme A ligase PaaK-like adenylate-forming protein
VLQFQVRQTALDRLVVSIVAAPSSDRRAIASRLRDKLLAAVGAEVHVDIKFSQDIPRGLSGKRRAVVSGLAGSDRCAK